MSYRDYCIETYLKEYSAFLSRLGSSTKTASDTHERDAQRTAIRNTLVDAMKKYTDIEPAELWKAVYSAHLLRKSGIDTDTIQIQKVISADQSWKKSSGHAFEEVLEI